MEIKIETQTGPKISSEIKQKLNNYPTIIGQAITASPRCAYVNLGGWVKPAENIDLNKAINLFERHLRKWVDNALPQLFNGLINPNMPSIRIVEHSDTSFATNKIRVSESWTYVSIELTIFFIQDIIIREQKNRDMFELLLYSLIDFVEETREFDFRSSRNI